MVKATAIVGTLCVTLLLAGCARASNDNATIASGAANAAATPKPKPNVGQFVVGGRATTAQLSITLVRIVDPYTPSNQTVPLQPGDRDVLIDAALTNVGKFEVAANRTLFSLTASDNHTYRPAITVTGHDLALADLIHGQTAEGDVVFEIPASVSITQLKYTPDTGIDDLTWIAP